MSAEEVQQSASTGSGALSFSSVSHPLHTLLEVSNTVNESDKLLMDCGGIKRTCVT